MRPQMKMSSILYFPIKYSFHCKLYYQHNNLGEKFKCLQLPVKLAWSCCPAWFEYDSRISDCLYKDYM